MRKLNGCESKNLSTLSNSCSHLLRGSPLRCDVASKLHWHKPRPTDKPTTSLLELSRSRPDLPTKINTLPMFNTEFNKRLNW